MSEDELPARFSLEDERKRQLTREKNAATDKNAREITILQQVSQEYLGSSVYMHRAARDRLQDMLLAVKGEVEDKGMGLPGKLTLDRIEDLAAMLGESTRRYINVSERSQIDQALQAYSTWLLAKGRSRSPVHLCARQQPRAATEDEASALRSSSEEAVLRLRFEARDELTQPAVSGVTMSGAASAADELKHPAEVPDAVVAATDEADVSPGDVVATAADEPTAAVEQPASVVEVELETFSSFSTLASDTGDSGQQTEGVAGTQASLRGSHSAVVKSVGRLLGSAAKHNLRCE